MTLTSDVYVWVWLPGQTEPVPAGVLGSGRPGMSFTYGRRYLRRPGAISLSPTLPLGEAEYPPTEDHGMPGAIRDGSPDAWGRRVVLNALTGRHGRDADTELLDERTYLLRSGSDRLGAIDFQSGPDLYVSRDESASLDELHEAAQIIEVGGELPSGLREALMNGTSMGGARPKALLREDGVEYLAKFEVSTDVLPVVGAEAASIFLAREVGIHVPAATMVRSLGKDVLLMERFDRPAPGMRRPVVSALTLLGLGEMTSRYGSYPAILDKLREHGRDAGGELFQRVAFNIAISNTDDHLRNHAAFWDGRKLELTPAYDLSPGNRLGETASQAIAYSRDGKKESNLASLIDAASDYGLSRSHALSIVGDMVDVIRERWDEAAEFGRLTKAQRETLWNRQFLNPGSLYGLP